MANEFTGYTDRELFNLATSEPNVRKLDGEEMTNLIHELGVRFKDMTIWQQAWSERR